MLPCGRRRANSSRVKTPRAPDLPSSTSFSVPDDAVPLGLARMLRQLIPGLAWSRAHEWIRTGKVTVDGAVVMDPVGVVRGGATVALKMTAPRPSANRLSRDDLVFVDAHVVVVRKPPGISTVAFEDERDTLDQLVHALLVRGRGRSAPLGVVHRIDKETSGLVVFARSLEAKRVLKQAFRVHAIERLYLALAVGDVTAATFRSRLVADRGDGRRGSTQHPRLGSPATTHVRPLERLGEATLIECRLETGRTHQIRIHLAEAGHPLLGERVYARQAGVTGPVPRMMLHAAVLGFEHPLTRQRLRFEQPMPEDMREVLSRLRRPADH